MTVQNEFQSWYHSRLFKHSPAWSIKVNVWLGLRVSHLIFPQPWDNRKGDLSSPEKNLGKDRSLMVARSFFSSFSCLISLLCYLQIPNVSILFFPVTFPIWKIQILYNHWRLQCFLPEKWMITQLSLFQLPQLSSAEDFPGWNQEQNSLAHTAGTCPPSLNILYSLTPFQEAYHFCKSGLKATSESWMATKTLFKKIRKTKRPLQRVALSPHGEGQIHCKIPCRVKGPIWSPLLEYGPGSRISLKSSQHLPMNSRWQRYVRVRVSPGKMEGSEGNPAPQKNSFQFRAFPEPSSCRCSQSCVTSPGKLCSPHIWPIYPRTEGLRQAKDFIRGSGWPRRWQAGATKKSVLWGTWDARFSCRVREREAMRN